MSRPRKHHRGLPTRVYQRGRVYWYVEPITEKWVRLGATEPEMYRALAELKGEHRTPGMTTLFARYETEVLPEKAPKTQHEQRVQLDRLRAVFGQMEPAAILPRHVARYLDERGAEAPVAANREMALLSHVFRKAVRWGLCDRNPCEGVERNRERPRDRYVTDAEFAAVYQQADDRLQVLMDLAYLTGQRQQDLLTIREQDITADGILFSQAKTGTKLCVVWSDDLRAVVARARALRPMASMWLVCTPRGQRYTSSGIQTAWQRLQTKCLQNGVISERFTFHDLRAKARSDGDDKALLGHADPAKMAKTYQRKPVKVQPVK